MERSAYKGCHVCRVTKKENREYNSAARKTLKKQYDEVIKGNASVINDCYCTYVITDVGEEINNFIQISSILCKDFKSNYEDKDKTIKKEIKDNTISLLTQIKGVIEKINSKANNTTAKKTRAEKLIEKEKDKNKEIEKVKDKEKKKKSLDIFTVLLEELTTSSEEKQGLLPVLFELLYFNDPEIVINAIQCMHTLPLVVNVTQYDGKVSQSMSRYIGRFKEKQNF